MKKILVMGGSYFIGKAIVNLLCNQYDVYVLNRGTHPLPNEKAHQITCDRFNKKKMREILSQYYFDVVIDVSGVHKKEVEILVSSLNTENIKSFVFISSSSVYDIESLTVPFKETNKLSANSYWGDYGTGKIESESYLTSVFENSKINLYILRPPYVYGADNYAQRESFIFNRMYNNLPVIVPNTDYKLQFISAEDLAKTVLFFINSTLKGINVFNVGNKESVTIKQWVYSCEQAMGKAAEIIEYNYKSDNVLIRDFFPFHDYDNVLDVSKIKSFYPYEEPFINGLKKAYKWYLDNKKNILFKENVEHNLLKITEKYNIKKN